MTNKLHLFNPEDITKIVSIYLAKKSNTLHTDQPKANYDYFAALTCVFILCLILSNIAVTKLCNFFGNVMPGGIIFFPFLYIINDIVTEVYGFSRGRKMIFFGLVASIIVNILLYCVVLIPAAPGIPNNDSFDRVFSISPQIFTASLVSYFFGELINALILIRLKSRYKGRFFVIRAIFSTFIGAFIEGLMFFWFVFGVKLGIFGVAEMTLSATVTKVMFEIVVMPITVYLVGYIKMLPNRNVDSL